MVIARVFCFTFTFVLDILKNVVLKTGISIIIAYI